MPSYFKLRTGLSRATCSYKVEYFMHDMGYVSSVVEYEDKKMYRCPAANVSVPVGADPATELEYEAALARCVALEKKRREEAQREAAFMKSLRRGMALNAHASHEAGAADLLEGLAHQPHFLDDFTVFDTETTGLSTEKDRLLEVAAIRYINWEPVAQMQEFVRFTGAIPHLITNLTGIREAHVRHAAEPKTVLGQLRKLAGESLLVGHNVSFDLRMLEAERTRLGAVAALPNKSLCTMQVAKSRYPAPHKLGKLCERFGIPVVGAHRALNDVLMTFALLRHMHQLEPLTQLTPLKPAKATQPSLFATAQ